MELCDRLRIYVRRDFKFIPLTFGPNSAVGMVTRYGLDGSGSKPGGGDFAHPSGPALGPPSPCKVSIDFLSGSKVDGAWR